jgi:hypothetical protein
MGQVAVTKQAQPSLIRSSHPGAQALHRVVGSCTWVLALVGVRPGRSGHARGAGAQRRCYVSANCWSAAGVDLCGTVGGRARKRIGRCTRPCANACKLRMHEGEIAACTPLKCFTWVKGGLEEHLISARTVQKQLHALSTYPPVPRWSEGNAPVLA